MGGVGGGWMGGGRMVSGVGWVGLVVRVGGWVCAVVVLWGEGGWGGGVLGVGGCGVVRWVGVGDGGVVGWW